MLNPLILKAGTLSTWQSLTTIVTDRRLFYNDASVAGQEAHKMMEELGREMNKT